MRRAWFALLLLGLGTLAAQTEGVPEPEAYLLYVASESDDQVTLVRFTPGEGLTIERVVTVGWYPADIEAPHGIFIDPSGSHWYVTLGHGFPFGWLVKYQTGTDTAVSRIRLGLFPATVAVPPFGGLAFAVNSDFHGELKPSTVSIVDLETMIEVERIETCTMPHGSRFSSDGMKHYSACMMDHQLVEIDAVSLAVARRLDVNPPRSSGPTGETNRMCTPTWAAPAPDDAFVYVTCNKSDEIVEVDVREWKVARRFPAPRGPYNAAVTPDGRRLVVTQKSSAEVSVWDRQSGERLALIPSTRKVTHGVAIPPDGRYAFISIEGIGGEPGAVDVIDLRTLQLIATVDVGKQAGGIAFWKMVGG